LIKQETLKIQTKHKLEKQVYFENKPWKNINIKHKLKNKIINLLNTKLEKHEQYIIKPENNKHGKTSLFLKILS